MRNPTANTAAVPRNAAVVSVVGKNDLAKYVVNAA
jgi:hypothetical protein